MSQTQASIGIDWGTHSSKWTWTWLDTASSKTVFGPYGILRSDVRLDSSHRILLSDEAPPSASIHESSIKGNLIRDPDAAFWGGPRRHSKLTLGELVSFSLWFLLGEAYQNLYGSTGKDADVVEIRFSLPNWVDAEEGAVGRASYEQAARVACYIFAGGRHEWSRVPHPVREDWQEIVRQALDVLDISDESEINRDPEGFRSVLKRTFEIGEDLEFRFVAESSAAGLTGLRDVEVEMEDSKYLRKILVVDVGAGSTDIGYVIRSIPPRASDTREFLCQLPPANTCELAGADLSRRIMAISRSRGEHIGFDEAERRKTVGEDKDWLTDPAVVQWKRGIAEHVLSYVQNIPDMRWLPNLPGLQVLVTGGSGVVAGLREEILAATRDGLLRRAVSPDVIDATSLMDLRLEGRPATDVNRLAVVLGACWRSSAEVTSAAIASERTPLPISDLS